MHCEYRYFTLSDSNNSHNGVAARQRWTVGRQWVHSTHQVFFPVHSSFRSAKSVVHRLDGTDSIGEKWKWSNVIHSYQMEFISKSNACKCDVPVYDIATTANYIRCSFLLHHSTAARWSCMHNCHRMHFQCRNSHEYAHDCDYMMNDVRWSTVCTFPRTRRCGGAMNVC